MDLTIYVYSPDLESLGVIDKPTGLIWTEKFSSSGSFELWCPIDDTSRSLLLMDNLIWPGFGESMGVIEFREGITDEEGKRTLHIQGRLTESYLDYRVVYPTFVATGKISDLLRAMVNAYLINPIDPARKIPSIRLAVSQPQLGPSTSYQQTGKTLLQEFQAICESNALGMRLRPNFKEGYQEFFVYQGIDRTIDQSVVDPVYISSELDDILSSSYQHNKSELRGFAYIAGAGEGAARKIQTVGSGIGIQRREIFVDARDLQDTKEDGTVIPADEYSQMLKERGWAYLEDYKEVESFDATIRTFGVTGYVYGKDFQLGDLVTVYDSRLMVKTKAVVSEAMRTFNEEGAVLDITFGYSQPTIAAKLKRRQ